MEKEYQDELEPINFGSPSFWQEASLTLMANPGKRLPVILKEGELESRLGKFHLSFVTDESKIYLQADGFEKKDFETVFMVNTVQHRWNQTRPGIYRLDITEVVKDLFNDLYHNPTSGR